MTTPLNQDTQQAVHLVIVNLEKRIGDMQSLLAQLKAQYEPLLALPKSDNAQCPIDYNVPVRGSTLTYHIYWALESQSKGEFTTRSLAHFLKKAEKYKTQTFEPFRTKIQNTLKSMRRNPKEWPNLGWRETRRPQGGTIYMYRWQK